MFLEVLRELNHGVLVGGLAALCVLGGALVWHGVQHVLLRRRGLAREAELLSQALPPDEELPHVLAQIPTFNEGRVIGRAAAAAGNLNWPRDKLHIQLLDDSTDGSVEAARAAVAALCARGIDAKLLHRADRGGFKAAALQAGLEQSEHEYVVGFDADFVPPRDFLRQCMRVLLADSGLAFVQARWDSINADQNALTRAQQRIIDVFFGIHQTARGWSGYYVNYSGSGGVWRRAAVDELGGWTSDTILDDLDITCRALLRGLRGISLVTVAIPGELPDSIVAWREQQYRWNCGLAQAMRKYIPLAWRSGLTLPNKIIMSLHLGSSIFGAVAGVTAVAAALEVGLLGPRLNGALAPLAAIGSLEIIAVIAMVPLSQRLLRGAGPWRELPRALASFAVLVFTHLVVALSLKDVMYGKEPAWSPTPKKGSQLAPPAGHLPPRRGVEGLVE